VADSSVYAECVKKQGIVCRCQGSKGRPCAYEPAAEEIFEYWYGELLVTTVHEPRNGVKCNGSFKPIEQSSIKTILRSNLRRKLNKSKKKVVKKEDD